VRRMGPWSVSWTFGRTPTVFVLGPGGQITRRGSGLMSKTDVLGALDEIPAG